MRRNLVESGAQQERGTFKKMDYIEKPHFTYILYHTLRKCRPDYIASEYKWRLGAAVIYELDALYNIGVGRSLCMDEKPTLYGIAVEIDNLNPYNIQLFEDITSKIAVDEKGANNG